MVAVGTRAVSRSTAEAVKALPPGSLVHLRYHRDGSPEESVSREEFLRCYEGLVRRIENHGRVPSYSNASVLGFGGSATNHWLLAPVAYAAAVAIGSAIGMHCSLSPALLLIGVAAFGWARYKGGMYKERKLDGETTSTFLSESRVGIALVSFLQGTMQIFNPLEKLCNPLRLKAEVTGEVLFSFGLLAARIVMNSCVLVWSILRLARSAQVGDWSPASVTYFLDSLVLAHLLGSLLAECRRSAIGQIVVLVRRLASESGLVFLRNLSLKQAKTSFTHYLSMASKFKFLLFPTYVAAGILGALAFLEKVSELPVQELKNAIESRTIHHEVWNILHFLMLANQLVSLTPVDEFEYQRLLEFVFARDDAILQEDEQRFMTSFSEAVYETLWAMPDAPL